MKRTLRRQPCPRDRVATETRTRNPLRDPNRSPADVEGRRSRRKRDEIPRHGGRIARLVTAILLAIGCPGCRSDAADRSGPVASLRAPTRSTRFDVAFWAEQQHRRSREWLAAWSYCRERSEERFPNCASIRLVGWIEAPPPPPAAAPPSFLAAEETP